MEAHIMKSHICDIKYVLTISLLCLLITFAISLYPDQDWQKVGPDLDSKQFDTDSIPERIS